MGETLGKYLCCSAIWEHIHRTCTHPRKRIKNLKTFTKVVSDGQQFAWSKWWGSIARKGLHEWLGGTGGYDLFWWAVRRGWPVTKTLVEQLVHPCHFCQATVQHMPKGQQLASLREGKLLWKTYTDPLKWTLAGWKCTLTGAGIAAQGMCTPPELQLTQLPGCCFSPNPRKTSVKRSQFKNKEVQTWCGWDGVHGFSTCSGKGTTAGETLVPTPSGNPLWGVVHRLNQWQTPVRSPVLGDNSGTKSH